MTNPTCIRCRGALDKHGEHLKACGKSTNPEYGPPPVKQYQKPRKRFYTLASLDMLDEQAGYGKPGTGDRFSRRAA